MRSSTRRDPRCALLSSVSKCSERDRATTTTTKKPGTLQLSACEPPTDEGQLASRPERAARDLPSSFKRPITRSPANFEIAPRAIRGWHRREAAFPASRVSAEREACALGSLNKNWRRKQARRDARRVERRGRARSTGGAGERSPWARLRVDARVAPEASSGWPVSRIGTQSASSKSRRD